MLGCWVLGQVQLYLAKDPARYNRACVHAQQYRSEAMTRDVLEGVPDSPPDFQAIAQTKASVRCVHMIVQLLKVTCSHD